MKQKIFKSLSILLSLLMIFSVCACVITTVVADETVYYVSLEGVDTNTGITETTPLLTIDGAVKKAVDAGYGQGDVVAVKVMGTEAVAWVSSGTVMTEHDFKLYVTSASADGSAKVGTGDVSVQFGGEVEIGDITINFGKTYKHVCGKGNNVTLSADAVYGGNNAMSNYSIGAWDGDTKSVYNDDITFINNIKLAKINILNNYTACTLNGRLNVVYNSSSVTPTFYISAYDAAITYNNSVNIDIKASKGAKFAKYSNGKAPVFGENGCFQVINSGTVDISIADTDLTLMPADKVWVLNNKSGANELISATDTKGKFAVDIQNYENIKAVSDTDSSVVINEVNGFLTLPAGQYTVTAEKKPLYATYYVSANGSDSNDGKSPQNAVITVQKAIELANADGYILGDYVTVKLLGETVNMGNMPEYEYNLNIEGTVSEDSVTRLVMNSNKTIANSQDKGLTAYKNVDLYIASQWSRYEATNSNIVFDAGTKLSGSWAQVIYGTNTDGGTSKSIAGQRIVVKTALPDDGISFGNFGWSKRTYTENVDLVLDYPSKHKIRFNTFASGESKGTETYNKNVNIYIEQAKGLEFCYFEKAVFNGALNLFNSSDVLINENVPGYDLLPQNTWILNNKSELKTPLIATDVMGEFATELDTSVVKIVATDSAENTYNMENGKLTLPVGKYDIAVTCVGEHEFGEYVNDNNASCGKNATETAVCKHCGTTYSKEIENTALTHTYSSVVDKVCNNCEEVREVSGNHLIKDSISGKWVLYEDGTISHKTAIAEVNGSKIYVIDGIWASDVTTIIKDGDKWLYIKDGVWDTEYSDLIEYQGKAIYIKNGVWSNTYSDLIQKDGRWYYIENGVRSYTTGIVNDGDKYVYVRRGKWDDSLTSLVNVSGARYYIENGIWCEMTDIVTYRGESIFIQDGIWNSAISTVFEKGDRLYAVKNGKWVKEKTLIYCYDEWYYADEGFVESGFSGNVVIDYTTYAVVLGVVQNCGLSIPVERPLNIKPGIPVEPDNWTPDIEETTTEIPRIICWGDSITRGMGMSKENKYPTVLQNFIGDGYLVVNGGSSGEKSHTIAARQGAHKVYLDKDIIFESGVSTVNIGGVGDHSMMLSDGTKLSLNGAGEAFTNDIPCQTVYIDGKEFTLSISNKTYYLTRSDTASALTLSEGAEVIFDSAIKQQGSYVEIFYVGANDGLSANPKDIEYLINRYKAMIERHGNDNYIIIIPQWDTGFVEPFKKEFGDKAVNLRGEMCSYDLTTVGLTPTEADIAEAKAGIIPTSLKYENNPNDSLHFNAYGYKMMGTIIYEHGVKLGYWK